MNPQNLVKILELAPIAGFLISYYYERDLILPTIIMMAFYTLFVLTATALKVKLNRMQIITWVVILILGAATVVFRNEQIIKWKTTIVNSIVAIAFLISAFIGQKTLTERLLVDLAGMKVPQKMLRRVNYAMVCYLLGVSALNLFIAYRLDTDSWVQFKMFGMLIVNAVFFGCCIYYLREPVKELMNRLENEKKRN